MIMHYIVEERIFDVNVCECLEALQRNYCDDFVHQYNVEVFYLFDQEQQLINTNPLIKNKLKELSNEIKKFKV